MKAKAKLMYGHENFVATAKSYVHFKIQMENQLNS